jgi:5'-methylthioadenosine phosphorylase
MGRLGVVLGSSVTSPGGEKIVEAARGHDAVVLCRHGEGGVYRPPHLIDHAANLRSLVEAGCDRVLAICSVGSLRPELGVGSFVCPDDFIALQLLVTTFDDVRGHIAPGFDRSWRAEVVSAWESGATTAGELRDGGVYWQANGPRFETPAEVRLIAAHADVVGMTLASECVVAGELGLAYAAICVVDNLANGIAARPLTVEEVEWEREANAGRLGTALDGLLPRLPG